jgi:hypothetical protein
MLKSVQWGRGVENTPTVFIRHYKDPTKIAAWTGTVSEFAWGKPMYNDKDTVRFRVKLERACRTPERLRDLPSGWYVEEGPLNDAELLLD